MRLSPVSFSNFSRTINQNKQQPVFNNPVQNLQTDVVSFGAASEEEKEIQPSNTSKIDVYYDEAKEKAWEEYKKSMRNLVMSDESIAASVRKTAWARENHIPDPSLYDTRDFWRSEEEIFASLRETFEEMYNDDDVWD